MRISTFINAPAKSPLFVDASIFLYALTEGPVTIQFRSKRSVKLWDWRMKVKRANLENGLAEERREEEGYGIICRALLRDGLGGRYKIFTTPGVLSRVAGVIATFRATQPSVFPKRGLPTGTPDEIERSLKFSCMRRIWALGESLRVVCPEAEDYFNADRIAVYNPEMPINWAPDLAAAEREVKATAAHPLRIASVSAKAHTMVSRTKTRVLALRRYHALLAQREIGRRLRQFYEISAEDVPTKIKEAKSSAFLRHPFFPDF